MSKSLEEYNLYNMFEHAWTYFWRIWPKKFIKIKNLKKKVSNSIIKIRT